MLTLISMLLAFALMVTSINSSSDEDLGTQETGKKTLELFAENIKSYSYDSEGTVESVFSASRITQYQSDPATYINTPLLETFNQLVPTWKIESQQGIFDKDDNIQLNNKVEISQLNSAQSLKINSEHLFIEQNIGYVSTDLPVIMTTNQGEIRATGMHFDLKSEIINLNSDVNATYEPKND